ncbi:MAG: choice-of-anchor Q domain-containing protein, partial [Bythopirellula sp.]
APSGDANGAGIFGRESVLNISDSSFTGNQMTGSNSEGAGLFAQDSDLTLTNSIVSSNGTTGTQSEGAGIYLSGGTTLIQQSTISLNTTTGLTASGGGIALVGGELTIDESTLDRNSTSGINAPGGSLFSLGGDVTIRNSTVSGSSASGVGSRGGGIFSDTSLGGAEKTLLLNSTVSGNSSAEGGGGIYNNGGLTQIRHSTITNNSVPFYGKGGGVASLGTAGSTSTEVHSSIIAGNMTTSAPATPISDVDSPGGTGQNTFVSQGYNVVGRGLPLALSAFNSTGDQTEVDDPMLGVLTLNGGPTFTHAPLENSPVVNAGDPAAIAGIGGVPVNDQRGTGFSRILAGQIDIGAVESPFSTSSSADFDSDGDIDGHDFLAWQRGEGTIAAVRSDGDANLDGFVNTVDLTIWQGDYGQVQALAAATAGGGSGGALASVAAASSEPLLAAAVSSSSRELTGLTLDGILDGAVDVMLDGASDLLAEEDHAEDSAGARDQLFSTLPLAAGSSYEELATSQTSGAGDTDVEKSELEVTVEDQVFDLLGA